LLQLNVLAVFVDAGFDPVLDVLRIVGVSFFVRRTGTTPAASRWFPAERDGAVSKHRSILSDGEYHVTRIAVSGRACSLGEPAAIGIFCPVETIVGRSRGLISAVGSFPFDASWSAGIVLTSVG